MSNRKSTYPLLPFSQYIYDMVRWMPFAYCLSRTLCWRGGAAEKDHVLNAIKRTIENHPVFQTRLNWRGRQYKGETFDSLHGRYFDLSLYTKGEDLYLKGKINVLIADGMSIQIIANDFLRAYNGLELEADNYWEYVENYERSKSSSHYLESKGWLEKEFADPSIQVRPTIDRRHIATLLPPKVGLYEDDYTDQWEQIRQLSETKLLPIDGIFSLCTAFAIAEYCGTDEAALTWANEGRDLKDAHICGCLHRDIPFKISRKMGIENRESAIRAARNQIRSGIAHSDYPYTLTAPYSKRWNYAVNVLRVPDEESLTELIQLPIEVLSSSPQKYAYALLDVEIHEHMHKKYLLFRYSATHYKESSIRRFADLIRKYVEWLIK